MGKKPKAETAAPDVTPPALEQAAIEAEVPTVAQSAAALLEPADQGVARLEKELADWKDRALRASADHENFRKRAARERDEMWNRGQGEVIGRILEVVDDLARVAHLDPAQTTAAALHEGMGLVERKFLKALESVGLERVDPAGQPFDPHSHEAVTTMPAASADTDHTVGAVFQHGYRFRGALLRPARVAVLQWAAPPEEAAASEPPAGEAAL